MHRARELSRFPGPQTSIVAKLVDMMFRFPPLFDLAAKGARSKIVKRAEQIGISWEDTIKQRKEVDWAAEVCRI